MNKSNLGTKIKELRNKKGISQEFLAEESGLSLRTIQRIENNHNIPRGNTLKRLALALDTSLNDISMMNDTQNEFVSQIDNYKETLYDVKFQISKKEFDKVLKIEIWGKYSALIYFLFSILMICILWKEAMYSIPLLIGAIGMLYSFFQHEPINKSNHATSNVGEFQNSIRKLRIHLLKHSKHDGIIAGIWFLTIIPAYLKLVFKISIYDNLSHFMIYILNIFIFFMITRSYTYNTYKKWDTELKNIDTSLDKIKDFEQ